MSVSGRIICDQVIKRSFILYLLKYLLNSCCLQFLISEKNFAKDRISHQHRKLIRRKLNYASSKCGAKILTSNPEARHRMAVLSEKPDEYFLNPCRITTWFVIELCDAVEATQVKCLIIYPIKNFNRTIQAWSEK